MAYSDNESTWIPIEMFTVTLYLQWRPHWNSFYSERSCLKDLPTKLGASYEPLCQIEIESLKEFVRREIMTRAQLAEFDPKRNQQLSCVAHANCAEKANSGDADRTLDVISNLIVLKTEAYSS